jgi:hypothetical protein
MDLKNNELITQSHDRSAVLIVPDRHTWARSELFILICNISADLDLDAGIITICIYQGTAFESVFSLHNITHNHDNDSLPSILALYE